MCRGSTTLAYYALLLMLSAGLVCAFPLHHVSPRYKLDPNIYLVNNPKTAMSPQEHVGTVDSAKTQTDNLGSVVTEYTGVQSGNSGISKSLHVIEEKTGLRDDGLDNSLDIPRDKYVSNVLARLRKRCVNCSGKNDVTSGSPVFFYDPLHKAEAPDIDDFDDDIPIAPRANNHLIILPLMAVMVFIGIIVTKCCRWTQKDVREVGFIVEAEPLKRKTIAKGIMQMHNFGLNRTARSKKAKTVGIKSPEQFMFLPLLLGQTINVTSHKQSHSRARTPPNPMKRSGSTRLADTLVDSHDKGFDASEDTDEEAPIGMRRSMSPPSRGSKGSRHSRSTSRDRPTCQNGHCPDIELDSSEEERMELEEQCRRGLAVLSHIDPVPLASKPSKSSLASHSSAGSTKTFSGQRVSVQAEVHKPAGGSAKELKVPRLDHGPRHHSSDACVDTQDLIEHIEDYYGVDIKAFINLWHHRRRFATITDAVDLQTAAAYARRTEFKRSQSYKKPKKSKPSMKRQVSFPLDLSCDRDSPPLQEKVTPPTVSRKSSTVDDDVFKAPDEMILGAPLHNRSSGYERSFEATVEICNLNGPKDLEFSALDELQNHPPSLTSSHHSICEDSGYHNNSFSKLAACSSSTGPPLHRTSSNDSAVATNLASESSHSNPNRSPCRELKSPVLSDGGFAASLSCSDLTSHSQERLGSPDSCAMDSMQGTPSPPLDDDSKSSSVELQGATCHAHERVFENGILSKQNHRPKSPDLTNSINVPNLGSGDLSDDKEKLLNQIDSLHSDSDREEMSLQSCALLKSGKDVPEDLHLVCGKDGVTDEMSGVTDEISDMDESFDSSPNAPLLHVNKRKSTDRENNNALGEHVV